MNEKKYTPDGYLIVSEMDSCPLWKKDTIPCKSGVITVAFFAGLVNFAHPSI